MDTDQRAEVWAKTNGHCWYCGKSMNPWGDFTVDHMDPRKQGGGNELTNLAPCCKPCNSQKHAKTVEEFRQYLQGKAGYRFWFEHAQLNLKIETQQQQEQIIDPEEIDRGPDKYHYEQYIWACIRVSQRISPGCALTLLHLFQASLDNYESTTDGISGSWFFHIKELAEETYQTVEDVFSHIMTFHSQGIIEISWQQGPQNGHCYIFHIDRMLSLDEDIRAQRLKQWREQRESNGS